MKSIKKIFLVIVIMLCAVSAMPEEFSDYANAVRQQIELLKEINARRDEIIASRELTIEEQKTQIENITAEANAAIADADEAAKQIILKDAKISRQSKILRVCAIVLIVKIIGSIVLLILHYKYKISVPYFVNTIF